MSDETFVVFDRGLIEERAWWVRRLADVDARTELRADVVGASNRRSARFTRSIPPPLVAGIAGLTGGAPLLVYTTLLCGVAACLARLGDRRTVVVGAPAWTTAPAGGTDAVALLVEIPAEATFRELLVAQREQLLLVAERQRYPLRRLLADLGLATTGASPLFGVMVASTSLHRPTPDAGHDVALTFEASAAPALHVELFVDRHAVSTVQRFVGYVLHLLSAALREPDRPVLDLPLIGPEEERRLVEGWEGPPPAVRGRAHAAPAGANLTQNQLLVWTGQKLQPGVPLYNMATLSLVEGQLDPVAFAAAWREVVTGTDALRTVVREQAGEPRAVVVDGFAEVVEHLDWTDEPAAADRIEAWARARQARPLDLTRCLFDCVVITLGSARWAFYLCAHHLIIDGITSVLLYRRAAELYERARAGEPPTHPPWPQFVGLVASDHAYRDAPAYRDAEAYWSQLLRPLPEPLRWFGRSSRRCDARTERVTRQLGRGATARLEAAAAKPPLFLFNEELSLLISLCCAVDALAHHLAGAGDVSVGVVFHNRGGAASRDVAGLVMEVAPVRVAVEPDSTFAGLARRNGERIRSLLPHLRRSVGNPGGKDHYDVLLNLQTTTFGPFGRSAARTRRVPAGHAHESLSIEARLEGGELWIELDLRADLFRAEEREVVADHLVRLVEALVQDPDGRLDAVPVETSGAPRVAVVEPIVEGRSVLELIAAQVTRRPDAVAVASEGGPVTFAELDRRATAIAAHVRAASVAREAAVAVSMDRGPALVAAVLGVLRAGAACVPIDVRLPLARRARMAEIAGVALTLRDGDVAAVPGASPGPAFTPPGEEDLAFVLFTSGTTGQPKAVELRHGPLARYARFAARAFALRPGDRVLQFASPSADTFCEEVFATLAAGATLVPRTSDVVPAPEELLRGCHAERITVLDLPTAYWHELAFGCSAEAATWLEHVRLIVLGGERLAADRLRAWRKVAGTAPRILNTYGPTECTIVTLTHPVDPRDGVSSEVPIGRPVPGTRAYVLDHRLRPAPIGAPGELYLGGDCLARGYRSAADLTAARFVPDPFATEPGMRMYRTGDRCVWLADGSIEYLGRADDQVKVRGYRVEPREVEAALSRVAHVADAAVVADGSPVRLVGYVALHEGAPADWSAVVRRALADDVPDYLVPSALVAVERIPRTPRGELDRRRLPPAPSDRSTSGTFVAPRGPVEEAMASIWRDVLELERVGARDNFFDLGGHSLLAVRVVARMLETFGVELPMRVLFERPCVADLAESVATSLAAREPPSLA